MTFSSSVSRERGPSVFGLFEFRVAENVVYRYTDADEEVFFGGETYYPEPITYPELVSDGTLKKTSITVDARYGIPPAKVFRVDPPSYVSTLTIYEGNFADPDREYRKVWEGRVLNCKIEKEVAKFSCEPMSTSLSRPGLRRNYQRPCPHALYGSLCGATKTEQAVDWVSGSGGQWVVTTPAANFISAESYEGGLVSWEDAEGFTRFQTILRAQQDGGNLVLSVNKALSPSNIPSNIKLVKGCTHTETACQKWHNNIQNYGGCPFIPLDTPINKFSTFY